MSNGAVQANAFNLAGFSISKSSDGHSAQWAAGKGGIFPPIKPVSTCRIAISVSLEWEYLHGRSCYAA